MTKELHDFLVSLGFDENATYYAPEDPAEASRSSLNAFIREHTPADEIPTTAFIRITGPAVQGHSAPAKTVGRVLTDFQGSIDAIGASLVGHRSQGGSLPNVITDRTEMSLIASPMPGSVVLEVAPTLERVEDAVQEGERLFDDETDPDTKSLAERAFDEFSDLLAELGESDADDTQFVEHLTELGQRVAGSVRTFCESVDRGDVDLSFEWSGPERPRAVTRLTHEHARRVAEVIKFADIENEDVTIEGTLVTVTQSPKDKLRIAEANGKESVIAIGTIPPAEIAALHTSELVRVKADKCVSKRPGGKVSTKLIGKSIECLSDPLPNMVV